MSYEVDGDPDILDIHVHLDERHAPDSIGASDWVILGIACSVVLMMIFGNFFLLILRNTSPVARSKNIPLVNMMTLAAVIHIGSVLMNEIFLLPHRNIRTTILLNTTDSNDPLTGLFFSQDSWQVGIPRVGDNQIEIQTQGGDGFMGSNLACVFFYFWLEYFWGLSFYLSILALRLLILLNSSYKNMRLALVHLRKKFAIRALYIALFLLPMYTLAMFITVRNVSHMTLYPSSQKDSEEWYQNSQRVEEEILHILDPLTEHSSPVIYAGIDVEKMKQRNHVLNPRDYLMIDSREDEDIPNDLDDTGGETYFFGVLNHASCETDPIFKLILIAILTGYAIFLFVMARKLVKSDLDFGYMSSTIHIVYMSIPLMLVAAILHFTHALTYRWGRFLFVLSVLWLHAFGYIRIVAPGLGRPLYTLFCGSSGDANSDPEDPMMSQVKKVSASGLVAEAMHTNKKNFLSNHGYQLNTGVLNSSSLLADRFYDYCKRAGKNLSCCFATGTFSDKAVIGGGINFGLTPDDFEMLDDPEIDGRDPNFFEKLSNAGSSSVSLSHSRSLPSYSLDTSSNGYYTNEVQSQFLPPPRKTKKKEKQKTDVENIVECILALGALISLFDAMPKRGGDGSDKKKKEEKRKSEKMTEKEEEEEEGRISNGFIYQSNDRIKFLECQESRLKPIALLGSDISSKYFTPPRGQKRGVIALRSKFVTSFMLSWSMESIDKWDSSSVYAIMEVLQVYLIQQFADEFIVSQQYLGDEKEMSPTFQTLRALLLEGLVSLDKLQEILRDLSKETNYVAVFGDADEILRELQDVNLVDRKMKRKAEENIRKMRRMNKSYNLPGDVAFTSTNVGGQEDERIGGLYQFSDETRETRDENRMNEEDENEIEEEEDEWTMIESNEQMLMHNMTPFQLLMHGPLCLEDLEEDIWDNEDDGDYGDEPPRGEETYGGSSVEIGSVNFKTFDDNSTRVVYPILYDISCYQTTEPTFDEGLDIEMDDVGDSGFGEINEDVKISRPPLPQDNIFVSLARKMANSSLGTGTLFESDEFAGKSIDEEVDSIIKKRRVESNDSLREALSRCVTESRKTRGKKPQPRRLSPTKVEYPTAFNALIHFIYHLFIWFTRVPFMLLISCVDCVNRCRKPRSFLPRKCWCFGSDRVIFVNDIELFGDDVIKQQSTSNPAELL